jgi:putative transposase
MEYRRSQTKGGTYFFTLVTYNRIKIFKNEINAELLLNAIKQVKQKHPFKMIGYVLLPDHFHCIWTLPENDFDFSKRWRLIKSNFTRVCTLKNIIAQTPSRKLKKEKCIWQRRFWEHQIRNEDELVKYLNYMHYNPVKHGYVDWAYKWRFSSFQHYVNQEIYTREWGSAEESSLNILDANE